MNDRFQSEDAAAFDYRLAPVPGIEGRRFRGPVPDLSRPFVAFVGDDATFGRGVGDPFASMVARQLGLPCLNLGLGGAGPRFAAHPAVLAVLQRARLVVVQMPSGSAASNSLYDRTDITRDEGDYLLTAQPMGFEAFLAEILLREDPALMQRIVRETRDDQVVGMRHLGESLRVPALLTWIANRSPDHAFDGGSVHGVLGPPPHLLDRHVVARTAPQFTAYVECVAPPHAAASVLHELAAARLVPAARALL
jgi:hypothetical protein